MEPPSSDAEPLRRQETAQVRASNGLLVTADEFCDLESSHQPVWQSGARVRGVGSAWRDFGSMRRIGVRRLAHRFLRTSVAPNPSVRRRFQWERTEPEWCGGSDRRSAICLRGGLGEAGFSAQHSAHARIVAGPETDTWRMCATHRTPNDRGGRHLVTRSRAQRLTMGFRPSVVRLDTVGDVPAAPRSPVASSAVANVPEAVGFLRMRPFQTVQSWVTLAVALGANGLKRSTRLEANVEKWRLIATGDRSKIRQERAPSQSQP